MLSIVVIVVVVIVLIVAFVIWRLGSVSRGARRRYDALYREVEPIDDALARGQEIDQAEVDRAIARPELRGMVYEILKYHECLDHFADQYRSMQAQAEADLVFWLCHPNELQVPPDEIQLVTEEKRQESGEDHHYFAFRYRTHEPHWAAKDGWLIGVAGPYRTNDIPYLGGAGTFSRMEPEEKISATEHIDWCHDNLKGQGFFEG